MVTHSSTSRPVQCLCMAERTGCPVLTDLWSYVFEHETRQIINTCVKAAYSMIATSNVGEFIALANLADVVSEEKSISLVGVPPIPGYWVDELVEVFW